jgi:hypothetical protein
LKNKGGPLTAVLGYRGAAPDLASVAMGIAIEMGKRIAAGLDDDEWVLAWLEVNGNDPGANTWNAVGLDTRGYWWIEDGTVSSRMGRGARELAPTPGHMTQFPVVTLME